MQLWISEKSIHFVKRGEVEEMKNKEKFAKEIIEVACSGSSIAVAKESGCIVPCSETSCIDCLFCDDDCKGKTKEWAESEYIEKLVISKRDIAFLEYIKEEYKFIARNSDGGLFVYKTQPKKAETYCNWFGYGFSNLHVRFDVDFPMVKWSDEEPWLIEDLKKLEVVDDYE